MAQVMVNFRMEESVKKSMEQACREMGLSMTTAFTIFATKVGREKRIPFEITARPHASEPCPQNGAVDAGESCGEEGLVLAGKQEQLEILCTEIRRPLTSIHTAIPASITGLSMERIRLLCGDELKDKAAGVSGAVRALFSDRNAKALREKDLSVLDEYLDGLSAAAGELGEIERALVPILKSWSGGDAGCFEDYERRLAKVSQRLDGLQTIMRRFWQSSACGYGSAQAVQARIRRAAASVQTAYVRTALEHLETLVLRHYDALESRTREHLESYYLQTLELTLRELGQAERRGGDTGPNAALCLRTVNVLSQVISSGSQAGRELSERGLEAEVTALERLAAMRGDIAERAGAEP